MYQGHPVGELFLMKESLFEQKSPTTVLQEGIRKNAAGFAGYQAIGMRNISLSGTEAVMHDFLYYPPGSPVQFAGRVVVLVVDKSAYTFFFNTTINTAAMLEGPFSEVVSSVRVVRKPVAPPRKVQEGVFTIASVGQGTRECVAARPSVTLVWPPRSDDGHTLICDGDATVSDELIHVRPTHAVLHRPAPQA